MPVEVHLTRWSRADLDHQFATGSAALRSLSRNGMGVSGIFEPNNTADIEVLTPRALTAAQRRAIRQLVPAAVFAVGTAGLAAAA